MKHIFLIIACVCAGSIRSHAQTITVMAEQLAALQLLQQTTTRGYQLMTGDLDNIGQITDGEFQLHQTYFGSLVAINPSLTGDPKLTALRDLQNVLIQQINAEIAYWRQQQNN